MAKIRLFIWLSLLSSPLISFSSTIWVPYVYFTPETQWAGGLLTINHFGQLVDGKTSSNRMYLTYTQNKQIIFSLTPQFYFNDNNSLLDLKFKYQDYPKFFYGIGNTTDLNERVLYEELSNEFETRLTQNILANYHAIIGLNYRESKINKIEETEFAIEQTIANQPQKSDSLRLDLGANWDSRDSQNSPSEGQLAQLLFSTSRSAQLTWSKVEIDYRKYWRIRKKDILAIQTKLGLMDQVEIRFDQFLELGGPKYLRGIYEGRLRGRALALLQSEYRYEWKEKWTVTTFLSSGHVQERVINLGEGRFYLTAGGGLHYFLDKASRTKGRLDAAISEEGLSFYLVMDDSF